MKKFDRMLNFWNFFFTLKPLTVEDIFLILRHPRTSDMTHKEEFTEKELEDVTMVFKQYETGVREACIDVKDLLPALVSLGLNMMEQEVPDIF